ncbi:MAG TPA: carboxylesterase family protein [Vicinamibacterales bacterium]|nr:carboxylesterase family protein [Vicinamibacterales bacterium]
MTNKASLSAAVAVAIGLTVGQIGQPVRAAITEPVRTENGLVAGVPGLNPDVRVFKGIPFAAPPVGALRWAAPQPAANWQSVRTADTFSANCMQRSAGGGAFPPYGGDRSATRMSEDCLYLNVFTTAASSTDRRPVMVWIHGGALTSGAGAIYPGEDLARKGVVVVAVNYRLGVFGFLAHPELTKESPNHVSGNYGFLDQIAALRWVQRNIAQFGGDPNRVTIFGESAGSWSVNYLVASPLAKGLFQRAIGESGGEFSPGRSLSSSEQAGTAFAASLNAANLAALRAMPADLVAGGRSQTGATVDGWFLPQDVNTIFTSGAQNDVPTIIGSNANEGSIFTQASVTGESFTTQSRRTYGADAEAFLKLYPFTTDADARAAQAASMRDRTFGWEMRTWARAQRKTGTSNVYLYYFSHVPPLPNKEWLGAQHGAEIPYVFNWPNGKHSTQVAWTDVDRKLADQVSNYWINFATTGDPNGSGQPKWPVYETRDDQVMGFGDTPVVITLPHKAALDFLDGIVSKERASAGQAQRQSR